MAETPVWVRKTREEYFRNHCPNFNNENSHDLTDVFWCMTKTAGLFGSTIYEIQEAWTGQDELQHANHMLRALRVPQSNGVSRHTPSWCPMILEWCNSLPLVWKRGSDWGHHCQPPEDSALQIGPHMWEVFLLPIHHVRGHPGLQKEELPTFSGGRSQWVILFSITTGMKYNRLTFPWWEPGQRIWGSTWHLLAHLIGDTPTPSGWTQKEDQREDLLPANPMHTHHFNLPTHRLGNCCHLWIHDCLMCLQRVLNFTTLEVKQLPNVKHIRS